MHRQTKKIEDASLGHIPPSPATADFSPDGVDLTLIRWMLSLTPAERLAALQQFVNSVLDIRERNVGH